MHRRQFMNTAAVTTATLPLARLTALAQTPPGDGARTLVERVTEVTPETLLEALLTTPVMTPLLPRDTPEIEPVPWEDESDADLDGAVGGVLFQTQREAQDIPIVLATAIVMPDAELAGSRLAGSSKAEIAELYGLPFFAQAADDYAIAVVQVGYLLLAGGAEAADPEPAISEGGATPTTTPIAVSGRFHLRAVANLAASLDHLEDILATLDA